MTRIAPGRPDVVLLSPVPTDSRVWGNFPEALAHRVGVAVATWPAHGPNDILPRALDLNSAAEKVVTLVETAAGNLDAVVAVGRDAPAAVHLARAGHVAAVVLIDPSITWRAGLDLDLDEDISPPSDDDMEALAEAMTQGDAQAFGTVMTGRATDDLRETDRATLAQVFADALPRVLLGPDWVTFPGSQERWEDDLTDLSVPILVVAPDAISSPVRNRTGTVVADIAPRGELVTVHSASEYPWLSVPDEVLRVLTSFFSRLAPGEANPV